MYFNDQEQFKSFLTVAYQSLFNNINLSTAVKNTENHFVNSF